MNPEPLAVVDAIRFEMDGMDFLLIKTPMPSVPKEIGEKLMQQLFVQEKGYVLALADSAPDGTWYVWNPPEVAELFHGRKFPASLVTKVPIYPTQGGSRL